VKTRLLTDSTILSLLILFPTSLQQHRSCGQPHQVLIYSDISSQTTSGSKLHGTMGSREALTEGARLAGKGAPPEATTAEPLSQTGRFTR